MTRRYNEAMDHIIITDETRSRILAGISAPDRSSVRVSKADRFSVRWVALAACLTLVVVGGTILPRLHAPSSPSVPPVVTVMPNIVKVDSQEALSQAVGFPVEVLPIDGAETIYRIYQGKLAEISCTAPEGTYVLRKSAGTEDNSGRYDAYDCTVQAEAAELDILLKGDAEGYSLALWSDGNYSWSLQLPAQSSEADVVSMISQIMSADFK